MRPLRVFAWASAAVAMLLVGAAATLWIGGVPLAAHVVARLASINGWQAQFSSIAVAWGDPIRLAIDDIELSRGGEAQAPETAFHAKRLQAELDRAALLRFVIRVRRLDLDQPVLEVATRAGEHSPWKHLPNSLAHMRELELRDARLEYRNSSSGAETVLERIDMRAEPVDEDGGALRIAGRGVFQGKPFVVHRAELARALLDDNRGADRSPRPVALEGHFGANKVTLSGNVLDLFKLQGLDVRVDMAGEDLQQVLAALAVPIPRMPIYVLAGQLRHDIGRWQIERMAGQIGGSELAGSILVESHESGPPYVRADLTSDKLDLVDLRGFYGGEPGPSRPTPSSQLKAADKHRRVIPDLEIPTHRLTGFTADVSLDASHVRPPAGWGIERLAFALSVRHGALQLDRLRVGTAGGGALTAQATLDAGKGAAALSLEMQARQIALRPLFAHADVPPSLKDLGGALSGSARLRSTGETQRQLLAGLEGSVVLLLQNGHLTPRIKGLVEGDVADAVEKMFGGGSAGLPQDDGRGRINCVIGRFDVADGVATATPLLLETPDTIVLGRGTINLGDETITFEVRPYAKDSSRRPVGVPLHVGGSFENAKVTADKAGFAARIGAALGLGALEVSPELKALLSAGSDPKACIAAPSGAGGTAPQALPAPAQANGQAERAR